MEAAECELKRDVSAGAIMHQQDVFAQRAR